MIRQIDWIYSLIRRINWIYRLIRLHFIGFWSGFTPARSSWTFRSAMMSSGNSPKIKYINCM
jgi:hypothetical protein